MVIVFGKFTYDKAADRHGSKIGERPATIPEQRPNRLSCGPTSFEAGEN
jgi:hypothetical protein